MMLFVKMCFTDKIKENPNRYGAKMELNKQNIKKILGIIVFTVALLTAFQHFSVVIAIISKILSVIAPVIIGVCIALILNVPMRALEKNIFKFISNSKRKGVKKLLRPISLVSTIILSVGFIALLMLIILPQLKNAVVLLINKIPYYAERIIEFVEPVLHKYGIKSDLKFLHPEQFDMNKMQAMLSKVFSVKNSDELINTTVGVTSSVISGVTNFALGAVLAVYILARKESILKFTSRIMKATLSEKFCARIDRIVEVTENSFSSFITGQFTDSMLLGILCFIGMSVLRLPSAAAVAASIGITALIPVIGPFIGEAIGFIIIFIESPLKAVFFLIFILILQAIDNNFIYPKVVGKSVGLPGLVVLTAVIIGGNIAGIIGILLGVPLASAIYILLIDALEERERKKKELKIQNEKSNIQSGELGE